MDQTNSYNDNNNMIVSDDNNNNEPVIVPINDQRQSSSSTKRKQLFNLSSTTQKCLLLFVLLSIILVGVVIGGCIWIIHLKTECNILNEHIKYNKTIQYMRQSQTEGNEASQGLMKNMRDTTLKRLRKLEKVYLINPCLRSNATTAFKAKDSSPTAIELFACLEACYICMEDYPVVSISLSSTRCNNFSLFFFNSRQNQTITVGQCAIVLIAVFTHQSKR
jgi:hypothetical protein